MSNNPSGYGPVGHLESPPVDLLVCFAVKEEAKFFMPKRGGACQVWLTGMGRKNAAQGIRNAVAAVQPDRVITAGFAGGLNPKLNWGTVLYQEDFDAGFGPWLEDLGVTPARFYCHRRVAITIAEKAELWQSTGADAVEMESSVIRTICHELHIPCATIRVISDDAHQDLPLDFNALMTSEDKINFPKLLWTLMSRPHRIPSLIEFQRQTTVAARKLGNVLEELIRVQR